MTHTGFIDWPRLNKSTVWTDTCKGFTYVYAFWLADYPNPDTGLAILRGLGMHPDWFCAGMKVDQVLSVEIHPKDIVSPNMNQIYEHGVYARPILAAICLGSADSTFNNGSYFWWAAPGDLTRQGDRLLKDISALYEREPVLLTFLDLADR